MSGQQNIVNEHKFVIVSEDTVVPLDIYPLFPGFLRSGTKLSEKSLIGDETVNGEKSIFELTEYKTKLKISKGSTLPAGTLLNVRSHKSLGNIQFYDITDYFTDVRSLYCLPSSFLPLLKSALESDKVSGNLSKEINSLKKDVISLREINVSLEDEKVSFGKKIDSLRKDNDNLNIIIKDYAYNKELSIKELELKVKEIEDLNEKMEKLKCMFKEEANNRAIVMESLTEVDKELSKLKRDHETLRKSNEDLNKTLEKREDFHISLVSEKEKTIDELNKKFKDGSESSLDLRSKLDAEVELNKELKSKLDVEIQTSLELSSKLDERIEFSDNLLNQINVLNAKLDKENVKLQERNNEIEVLKSRIEEVELDNNDDVSIKSELSIALSNRSSNVDIDVKKLTSELDAKIVENKDLRYKNTEYVELISGLNNQIVDYIDTITGLKKEIDSLNENKEDVNSYDYEQKIEKLTILNRTMEEKMELLYGSLPNSPKQKIIYDIIDTAYICLCSIKNKYKFIDETSDVSVDVKADQKNQMYSKGDEINIILDKLFKIVQKM